jgi:hypothetical protein
VLLSTLSDIRSLQTTAQILSLIQELNEKRHCAGKSSNEEILLSFPLLVYDEENTAS